MGFEESQKFSQPWVWLLMLVAAVPMWLIFLWQIVLARPVGRNPIPDSILLVVFAIVGIGLPALFYFLTMNIVLEESGIRITMTPWTNRLISYSDITSAIAREYNPVKEYGGWGVRSSRKNGIAYNIKGTRGVQLVLSDGKRILLGSQRADELAAAINQRIPAS